MKRQTHGFTLLELLTVVAIMVILMSIAGASYYGMSRGAALTGAVSNLGGTLSLSRQFSMMHRDRTHVIFSQEDGVARYMACVEDGAHTGSAGIVLKVDRPRWAPGTLGGGTIYNLTTGERGTVSGPPPSDRPGQPNTKDQLSTDEPIAWNTGDRCGWIIHDQESLPAGIVYGDGQPGNAPDSVIFNPDGTTPRGGSGNYTIPLDELQGSGHKTITVDGLSGLVR